MPTNLALDDKLLNRALKIGGRRTKKETVNEALAEYVQRRERKKVIEAFGTVDYVEGYHPKKYRK
jgi:Arc/MetJ family transcription regulator